MTAIIATHDPIAHRPRRSRRRAARRAGGRRGRHGRLRRSFREDTRAPHVARSAACARSSAAARTRRTSAKSSTSPAGIGGSSSTSAPVTAGRRSPQAAADPDTFVLAIDADARSMAEASRRAAARPSRGGLPNVVFVADGRRARARRLSTASPTASRSDFRGARSSAARSASTRRSRRPSRVSSRRTARLEIVLSIVERDRAAVGGAARSAPRTSSGWRPCTRSSAST